MGQSHRVAPGRMVATGHMRTRLLAPPPDHASNSTPEVTWRDGMRHLRTKNAPKPSELQINMGCTPAFFPPEPAEEARPVDHSPNGPPKLTGAECSLSCMRVRIRLITEYMTRHACW